MATPTARLVRMQKLEELRDGSVSTVLATQASGPEFRSNNNRLKSQAWLSVPGIPVLGKPREKGPWGLLVRQTDMPQTRLIQEL